MDSRTSIDCLPDDALVEIFSHVTFHDLIQIQRVSTRWKRVTQYTELWRNRVYTPDSRETDCQIASAIQQAPKLRTLILKKREVHTTVLHTFMNNCSYLRKVVFNCDQKLSSIFLKNLVSNCPNIEYLHLPNKVLNKLEHAEIVGQFPNLKTLVVGNCANWDWEYPALVKPLADGCAALQHLDLKNEMHLHDDMAYFLHKKRNQLQSLSVCWTSADWKCTIPLLLTCAVLKTLHVEDFCDGNITYNQDIYIQPYFQPFWSLKTVTSLTLCTLNDANVDELVRVFHKRAMNQLIELRIIYFKCFKDVLAKVIIDNCPRLQVLHFDKCFNLTDQSVENLFTLELQSLNLCDSGITDHGMACISKCEKLTYLNLSCCIELTENGMRQMINFSSLKVLKLQGCDLKGLPLQLFSTHLKQLSVLDIKYCLNVDQEALLRLKIEMPRLIVKDLHCKFVDENGVGICREDTPMHSPECEEYDVILENAPFLHEELRV